MQKDDVIYRQAAIETALEFFIEFMGGAFHEDCQKQLIERLNKVPAIDVAPVVRCKNCVKGQKDMAPGLIWCEGRRVNPNGFCEKGDRREE